MLSHSAGSDSEVDFSAFEQEWPEKIPVSSLDKMQSPLRS
jgi:hypothetical protein